MNEHSGYIGDEQVGLHRARPSRPAPVRRNAPVPRSASVISGVVSGVRKDTEPFGQGAAWQIVSCELQVPDSLQRVAVQLRGLSLKGPIPTDGAHVRAHGGFNRAGVFVADRIVNTSTGHTLVGRRKAVKALVWVVGAIVVVFLVFVFSVVIKGFLTFDERPMPPGNPGITTQDARKVTVPSVADLTVSEAIAALQDAGLSGFDHRVVQQHSDSVPFGDVIGTTPPVGTVVEPNGRTPVVTLNVSIGAR